MSKYLALEWDEHEMRLAIASGRGSTAVLEKAFAVPLPPAAEGQPHSAATVAGVLREALAGESLRRVETLAVVGRPSIELKELSLPPAPDDELPDLVRFQALRDFTQLSDDTPLDFIPLPGEDKEHRSVLAAAISKELLGEIRSICEQAGLELKHLVLRPCAAAALLKRHQAAAGQVRMFVDLLRDEVDLTVLDQDTPLLMRTTRLPGDASQPEFCRPVFLEIRRTIAAVQNKLHGRRVEQIWLCGDGPSQQTLAEMVKSELDLPTELFDPFTAFELSGALKQRLPEHHSRFAPLLGMLADAVAGDRHTLDFLQPRQRPAPKSRQRELAIGIACAAVLLLGFIGWTWWQMDSLDGQIAQLQKKRAFYKTQITKNSKVEKEAAALNTWLAGDIPWLDVLHRLSTQGPKGEEVMLASLKAEAKKGGGGKLTLDVLASEPAKAHNQLRKVFSETEGGGFDQSDGKVKRYKWKIKTVSSLDRQTLAEKTKSPVTKAGIKPGTTKTKDAKAHEKSSPPAAVEKADAKTITPASQPPNGIEAKTEPAPSTPQKAAAAVSPATQPPNAAPATTESTSSTTEYFAPAPAQAVETPGATAPEANATPAPASETPATTTETKDG